MLSFVIFLLLIALVVAGTVLNKKPIRGTCGGLAGLKEGENCSICGAKKPIE